MLDDLRTMFAADAGLESQVGEHIHRCTAPANAGEGTDKKYVTYRPVNDPRILRTGAVSTTVQGHRIEFRCHGRTHAAATAVYDALIAVLGTTRTRGTWGSTPIQDTYWDGDTYDETFIQESREYRISIELVVTWTRS